MSAGDCIHGVPIWLDDCEECEKENASKSAFSAGLCGPLTIPVKTVRKALESWLHAHVLNEDVKISKMTFQTDGQVEITFKHLNDKPT